MDPVLIVGSGLSGLAAALFLAKNGVPVRIIERDAQFHSGQRGSALMPRTLELYSFLGVLPDILEGGMHPLPRCMYGMPEGRTPIKIFEMLPWEEPTPDAPFRGAWTIGQAHNEEILRNHLAKHGVQVELNTELAGFEQDDSRVNAHIIKRNGDERIYEDVSAAFLIGGDGAGSTVRKTLRIPFVGETLDEQHMLLADIEMTGLNTEYWHSWGDHGPCTLYLRPTEYKNIFSCLIFGPEPDFQLLHKDPDALFTFIKDLSNRHELEFGRIKWMSEWRANIRMATKFGEGRVFLVGDAAHIHAPHGAQGFNSGVQDSCNLAWKLSLVYNGLADRSLLETYSSERVPVIEDMIPRTTAIFEEMVHRKDNDPEKDFNVTAHIRPKILYQLGINYRWSPIVLDEQPEAKDAATAGAYLDQNPLVLFAGDRAPDAPGLVHAGSADEGTTSLFSVLSPTRHTLLVFVAEAEQAAPFLRVLDDCRCPSGAALPVTKVILLPANSETGTANQGADMTVVDQDGYAHLAYPPVNNGFPVVVVRPDGVVGAVLKEASSLQKYLMNTFSCN